MKHIRHFLCVSLALLLTLIPLAVPAAAEETPATSNEVTLIDEDFSTNDPTNAPESLKTLNLTPENGEGLLSVTPVAGGVELSGSKWSISELASKEQLTGVTSFTLTAKISIDVFGSSNSQFTFRFGQDPSAAKNNIKSSTLVQLYGKDVAYLIGGNRDNGGWISSGEGAKTQVNATDIVVGKEYDLTLTVDNVNKTCSFKLENKADSISLEKVFEHILTNDSNLSIVAQNQTTTWKNIKLTATYATAVDLLGAQVTTEITSTYGIRFISRIYPDNLTSYGAVGIRVVAEYGDGQSKTFTGGEGNTVYRSVLGNVAGEATTYKATDFGAAYLFCVTITDIPVSEGVITFTVTPYLRDMNGKAVEGTPVVFTVNAGVIQ